MSASPALKLLVTGGTGLVGSAFVENFKDKFIISSIGRTNVSLKVNLTSEEEVRNAVFSSDAEAVINFAAFTAVDRAESEKGDKSGEVYMLNALLPLWLSKACKKSGKSLYHISTDYVFDGRRNDRPYTEEDLPKPVDSWYAITKFFGEINIQKCFEGKGRFAIIRISYPYSATFERKLDFARVIIEKLSKGENYFGSTDQKIKPTSVVDIARALELILEKKAYGIYNVAGKYSKGYISPYDFAKKVAAIMKLNTSLIKPISFIELSRNRVAPRPQNTWIDTTKIENLGIDITNFEKSLERFQQQFLKLS